MPVPPPVAVAVEVVATQPEASDAAALAAVRRRAARERAGREDPTATYVVKLRLETPVPATGAGWALFVGDFRIPKYWEYAAGIYFKVYDPGFLDDHADAPLRFSADAGRTFVETGLTLGRAVATRDRADLPTQREVLSG